MGLSSLTKKDTGGWPKIKWLSIIVFFSGFPFGNVVTEVNEWLGICSVWLNTLI